MLKTITLLSKFLIFVVVSSMVLVIALLISGINLTNLSYGNISISQLYLKYDKKLILNITNLEIQDKNKSKSQILSGNISVTKLDNKYFIELKNIYYQNIGLQVSGNTYLTKDDIHNLINNKDKKITLNDVKVNYDKHLSDVIAKNVFLNFNGKDLIITFNSPSMSGVKLDGSKVILKDITTNLMLKLDLYTHNSLDKKILKIIKYYGVDIPIVEKQGKNSVNFKLNLPFDDRKIEIYVKAHIKDGVISFNNIDFNSKDIDVVFKDNILNVNSKKIDLVFLKQPFILNNMDMKLDKNIINIIADVIDENSNTFDTNNNLNLKTKIVSGRVKILNYKYKNIKVENQNINYNLNFTDDIDINIKNQNKTFNLTIKDKNLSCEDLGVNINNNIVTVNSIVEDDKNNSCILHNITNIDKHISNGDILINKFNYDRYATLSNKSLQYDINYTKDIEVSIPNYGLKYTQNEENQMLNILKFDNILKDVNFLKLKKDNIQSTLRIFSSNNFTTTNMIFNHLNIDINSTKLLDKKEDNSTRILPNIDIKVFNSDIKYDNHQINATSIQANTIGRVIKVNINPKKEKFQIFIDIYDRDIKIKANNITPRFINLISKKDIFNGGYLDIDANGTFDILQGKIKFHKTTVQNVMVLNNLISFINTTPAIINPLLALPTLFRMSETGFNMTGYYIEKGNVDFKYNIDKRYMNILKVYTKSTMTDFEGKGFVDIKNDNLKLHMDVIFLKDYSKAINYIPVLGYIITGDDGNFVTTVDIKGTFKEQTFETHTVKNASQGVFNVIKRTLTVPFLPFMDNNKTKEKK